MVETKKTTQGKTGENTRKRIPLGTRNVLTAPKKPGFVRRFVNDTSDRIQQFKDAGWSVVKGEGEAGDPKLGRASSMGGATNPEVGQGQRAVLMELPTNYYEEDQQAKQNKIDQVEREIRRNSATEGRDGLSGKVTIS